MNSLYSVIKNTNKGEIDAVATAGIRFLILNSLKFVIKIDIPVNIGVRNKFVKILSIYLGTFFARNWGTIAKITP